MRYSIKPRDRIYGKGYGFSFFAKQIGKNLSNKYSQKFFDRAKKFTNATIKNSIEKSNSESSRATGDLIGSKIADKIISI